VGHTLNENTILHLHCKTLFNTYTAKQNHNNSSTKTKNQKDEVVTVGKLYRGMEVYLHGFITSALYGG
jgi:hypothetical protein